MFSKITRHQRLSELVKLKLAVEWTIVLRALKAQDPNGLGTVTKAAFQRIVHNARVHLTTEELAFLSERYPASQDALNYHKLSKRLLGHDCLSSARPISLDSSLILDKLRLSASFRKSHASSFARHSSVVGTDQDAGKLIRANMDEIKSRLRALDKHRTGVVSEQEMQAVLASQGVHLKSVEAQAGLVEYVRFLRLFV